MFCFFKTDDSTLVQVFRNNFNFFLTHLTIHIKTFKSFKMIENTLYNIKSKWFFFLKTRNKFYFQQRHYLFQNYHDSPYNHQNKLTNKNIVVLNIYFHKVWSNAKHFCKKIKYKRWGFFNILVETFIFYKSLN